MYLDQCVLNVCLAKANNLHNKYTEVEKHCFNLNPQANYRPQGEFDNRAEEGNVCLSIYLLADSSNYSLLL